MAEASWVSYLGAVTGVSGLILSALALWRTERVRNVERAIVVGKALATLNHRITELPELLLQARRSYEALAAAEGRMKSGATEAWLKEWDEDRQAAQALVERRPDEDKDLRLVPFAELARYELVIHKISQKVDLIEGRYRASMASDERGVERRKQAAQAEALSFRKATAWAKGGPFDPEK